MAGRGRHSGRPPGRTPSDLRNRSTRPRPSTSDGRGGPRSGGPSSQAGRIPGHSRPAQADRLPAAGLPRTEVFTLGRSGGALRTDVLDGPGGRTGRGESGRLPDALARQARGARHGGAPSARSSLPGARHRTEADKASASLDRRSGRADDRSDQGRATVKRFPCDGQDQLRTPLQSFAATTSAAASRP